MTTVILEFCENALSDLSKSMTSLMTLDSTVSPRDLKSELRKCKQDTTQQHSFGELFNVFCRIKDNVQSNTIKQIMVNDYISCFKDLTKFMTVKWICPATMNDMELIEKQFFSVVASTSLATDQARQPAAIRQDRPQHYGALKFNKTDLPRFIGQESSYLTFRRAFQEGTDRGDVNDYKKCILLAAPNILSDDKIQGAIVNLKPHSEQWRYLDEIYLSKARAVTRVMKGYLEMDRIDKLDQRFVDFVHSHMASVRRQHRTVNEKK